MPKTNQNLIGKHFGHLTVVAKSKKRGKQHQYLWVCKCDCGRTTIVSTGSLNSGVTTSCGHVRLEKSKKNLRFTESRHLQTLNNRPPVTNKSGYRNIRMIRLKSGAIRWRVFVVYNHKQHAKQVKTLEEALKVREILRRKWWPNYKKNKSRSNRPA